MGFLKAGFLKNNKYFDWFCYALAVILIILAMALKLLKSFSKSAQKGILNGDFVAKFWLTTPPKMFVGMYTN